MISVSTLLAIPLALATAAAPAHRGSTKDAAGAPAADAHVIQLEIDATKLESFEAPTRTRLEHELPAVVTQAGLRTAKGDEAVGAEANVRIVITFGKSKIDYEYEIIAVRRNGDRITQFAGACTRCVREDAVKLIVSDTTSVLERVRAELRKPPPAAEGTEPVGPAVGPVGERAGEGSTPVGQGTAPVPPDGSAHTADASRRGLGGRGIAGAVMIGLGAPALGVGIGLAVRPVRYDAGGLDDPQRQRARDTRGVGIGVAVAGAVALTTGVILLALDRSAARTRRLHVAPAAGEAFGLSAFGRF